MRHLLTPSDWRHLAICVLIELLATLLLGGCVRSAASTAQPPSFYVKPIHTEYNGLPSVHLGAHDGPGILLVQQLHHGGSR